MTERIVPVVMKHFRRYMPFYVFATFWVVMVSVLPTAPVVRPITGDTGSSVGTQGSVALDATLGAEVTPGPSRALGSQAAGASTAVAAPVVGAGVTRGGLRCVPGVRQLPDSAYAAPCRAKFTGPNGGATVRGVTARDIKVVVRDYADDPSSQALEAIVFEAGAAPPEDVRKMRDVFIKYFNETYELYGRRLVFEDFHSTASLSEELQNRGREQACADATAIAEERKAFAVLPDSLGFGPFSECAAERKMLVPHGPYGFPESWYRRYHPYAWGVQMSCDRISLHVAEYSAKRLAGRKARWALSPVDAQRVRVFGGIGPDIAAYAECIDLLRRELRKRGVNPGADFRYSVDVASIPQQAAQAVARFKAAGVTTLILGSDFVMNINLTQQARAQEWGPEWVIIGAGFQDFDNFTRLYEQERIDGHLFGLSELGATEDIIGPQSEPARLYRKVTGQQAPSGTDGNYFGLIHLYNMVQAAGPNLSAASIAPGTFALPSAGAPAFASGEWSFASGIGAEVDHTAVDDSREVYWDGQAAGYDGERGTFRETYGGRRFLNGQWPAEEPKVYPDR